MSKALEVVTQLVGEFTESPRWVFIDEDAIDRQLPIQVPINTPPALPEVIKTVISTIAYELIAGFVNYCYWYGAHDIRPNGASATQMYKLLSNSFKPDANFDEHSVMAFHSAIESFSSNLAIERFPLVVERTNHLLELIDFSPESMAYEIYRCKDNLPAALDILLKYYPGYAQDMFIKRASLFFMQTHRQTGLFADQIDILPVPADYQVPKMLHHFGILKYNNELESIIKSGTLIPQGSRMECEIRASTIKACRLIATKANLTSIQVDDWLWLNRKASLDKFHLTITTDY